MFGKITKAVERLADALYGLTAELALIRKAMVGRQAEAATTQKPARWTDREEEIVRAGYNAGLYPDAIREALQGEGFHRTAHAIVNHMHELRKREK